MKEMFDYKQAFSRNLGLIQPAEQIRFRRARVAIAGLGAVGGMHLVTLARMGLGNFHIADLDAYELVNMNRQVGATMETLGRPKVSVMEEMVRSINPSASVMKFADGIHVGNIGTFLEGVDVAIDGLDYFAIEARDLLYLHAARLGIPVVSAGPFGCSATLLVFMPGGMTWREYYSLDLAESPDDRFLLFAIGTAPKGLQLSYMDRRYVRMEKRSGPSLAQAVQLCAGVVAAEVMKLVLGRGKVYAAPYYQQFDAYKCRHRIGKLRWGNRGPLQRVKFRLIRRWFKASVGEPQAEPEAISTPRLTFPRRRTG